MVTKYLRFKVNIGVIRKKANFQLFVVLGGSSIKIRKNSGLNTDPCGTPPGIFGRLEVRIKPIH